MKAIRCEKYGSPEVLQLREVEKPTAKDHQVLVRVEAASANPFDWHLMRATPFIARVNGGFFRPKDTRVGVDFAGRVESIGGGVTRFKPGDEVFGFAQGSFAEYAVAGDERLAAKPNNLSFEATAAFPMAAITALQSLRDGGRVHPGLRVLINGASGGVGTFAVQIAKSFGAEVTGVCSTQNQDLVRSIGADHVIDYTKTDFTRDGHRYDVVLDAVGNISVSGCKRALNPGGIAIVVGFPGMSRLLRLIIGGKLKSKNANRKVVFFMAHASYTDFVNLKELAEAGKVKPVIEGVYKLGEVPKAIRHLEEGHARGKLVITLESGAAT